MNVMDEIKNILKTEDPDAAIQEALTKDPLLWVRFLRRHDANIFDALFLDKDYNIHEKDIKDTIKQVSEFFELPMPIIQERADTLAEVITSEHAEECQLYYDWKVMEKSGINNMEALLLAFLHELAHQYLTNTRFMLFENELWIQELAADLLVGAFSVLNGDVATGKYKYVVSTQKATLTHPDGELRKEIVVYGRNYVKQLLKQNRYHGINDILTGLPAFVYSHYKELHESWDKVSLKESAEEPKKEQKPIDYESLSDDNLLKKYWIKHNNNKKTEDKQ